MNTALDELLKSQPALWRGRDQHNDYSSVQTGFSQLNKALPSGGWGVGCVTELLIQQEGIGELSLLLPGLHQVTAENQWAALVNPPYLPYAPALANAGINLERLLIINTNNDTQTLWATEQILRTGLFAAVVSWVNRTSAQKQRRLQLAAEIGQTWVSVYRPASAGNEHSPAAFRIVLSAEASLHATGTTGTTGTTSTTSTTSINAHTENPNTHHLLLNIIKSRGGKQQRVVINPAEFDRSQGVEWPGTVQQLNQVQLSNIASVR